MKNKFIDLYLTSLAALTIGSSEIFFNYTKTNTIEGLYSGVRMLFIGILILVYTIVSHIKYNTNRKQMERELAKEYDERDELIDGKVSSFTIKILITVIILIMFLSRFIMISTNDALFIIIISYMITSTLAKKYYNYYF